MSKVRDFRFVLNNYTQEEEDAVKAWDCRYLVFGHEIAPTTGTPHLQGYVYWHSQKTFSACKKLNQRMDWRTCDATPEENREYCIKDGDDVFEKGICPMSQKNKGDTEKQRWAEIIELAENGDWEKLKLDHPKVYANQLQKLEIVHSKRPRKLENLDHETIPHFWYYGDPGTGKSLGARREAPDAYIKDPKTKWWNLYDLEDDVIIDDFDKYQVAQGGDMKRWLDIYPFMAECKGTQMMIRPKRIIVTSNYHPNDIWDDEITRKAIARRCQIIQFGKKTPDPQYHALFNPPK
jgi:hypothetical protein